MERSDMNRTLPGGRLYSILGAQVEQRLTLFQIGRQTRRRLRVVLRARFILLLMALMTIPLLMAVCGESSGPGSAGSGSSPSARSSVSAIVVVAPIVSEGEDTSGIGAPVAQTYT